MKQTSKAQVEVQFNWIFILIAGSIILAFFVVIAVNQKRAADTETNIGFFTGFEKAIGGISAVQGKTLLFEIPSLDLRYDCTDSCDCAAYAGASRAKAQITFGLNDRIIFSPNSIKGNSLLTWSKDWNYPFRITNFIFMTSPEVKYLVEDTDLGRKIYDELPPNMIEVEQKQQRAFDKDKFTASLPITGITGNYKAKFVFTDTKPEDYTIPVAIQSLPDEDVTAVKFDFTDSTSQKVDFYQKDNTDKTKFKKTGESYVFGDATYYAAIFSEDINSYSCMMNNAFKSFSLASRLAINKINLYSNYSTESNGNCGINYDNSSFKKVVSSVGKFDFKIPNKDFAIIINRYSTALSYQNGNAIKSSCPQIY